MLYYLMVKQLPELGPHVYSLSSLKQKLYHSKSISERNKAFIVDDLRPMACCGPKPGLIGALAGMSMH